MTVTDEDRKAASSVAVLVEMREFILAGKADHHAEPFAAHRQAAYAAGLERAAVIAKEWAAVRRAEFDKLEVKDTGIAREILGRVSILQRIVTAIRAEKDKP
jgi:hypothetical protein